MTLRQGDPLLAKARPIVSSVDKIIGKVTSPMQAFNSLGRYSPQMLGILRIVTALIFILHGTQKLFGFPAPPASGLPAAFTLFWFGAILEAFGGLLILVGFQTRLVAFILAGEMAYAYWMFHAPRSLVSDAERRRCRDPLLLRLPLPGLCRRGRFQRRRPQQGLNLAWPPAETEKPALLPERGLFVSRGSASDGGRRSSARGRSWAPRRPSARRACRP